MATTTVVVEDHHDSTALAQRLVVWALHDKRIRTTHTGDGKLAFVVPDDLVADILEYGGSGTIDLGGTGPGAEIDTSVGGTVAPTFQDVTGIDPNSYNHEKDAPTDLTVTPLLGLDGEPIPGAYLITWTYEERHSHFVVRYRTQAEEDAPENPWRVSHYPPYARQARVYGVPGTIEVNLQAVVREGFYVPIASALATGGADPTAMTITATCDPSDEDGLSILVTVDNSGEGPVTLDAGGGLPTQTNPGDGTTETTFTYAAGTTGAQTITGTDADDPTRTGTATSPVLPCPPPPAAMVVSAACDDLNLDGLGVLVTVDNDGQGPVTIDAGADLPTQVNPGDGTTVTTFAYPAGTTGAQTINVVDNSDEERTGTATSAALPCPAPDMVIEAVCDAGGEGLAIDVFVNNFGRGPVTVNAGGGLPTQTTIGDNNPLRFVYSEGTTGVQTITAVDDTDSERTGEASSPSIPCTPEALAAPLSATSAPATARTVKAAASAQTTASDPAPTTGTAAKKTTTSAASTTRKKVSAPVKSSTTDQK